MHNVSTLQVVNFRSIKDATFHLTEYTPLVGYNNAGKTNILQALNWLFKKSSLQRSDFFDPISPISVTAEIIGINQELLAALTEQHRLRIEQFILDEKLTIRRKQVEPAQSMTSIKIEVLSINGDWTTNPTGIDAAISNLFPDPIFIGAMEDVAEDVGKYATGTTIGKLIKEIVGDVAERNASKVTAALAEVANTLSADSPNKDETLADIDRKIQAELKNIFPGVTAKIHIQVPEFDDFLKNATLKIFDNYHDNSNGRDASSFGHGAQRSIQISLIKCLSEVKRGIDNNTARTTLLLIDEPELYLHPQAIELVRSALSRLSKEGYQVVFTTHSANMIARSDAPNALLIRRSKQEGTKAFPRLHDAVKNVIQSAAHQSETIFSLSNSTKVLFSEKLLLAEGKTERVLFPDIFIREFSTTLDEARLGLIELGGSANIPNAIKVLKAMGIPTKAVVDLDFVFKVAPKEGLIQGDDSSLLACRQTLRRLESAGKLKLDTDGMPTKSDKGSAAQGFALMASETDTIEHIETLHYKLRDQGIWFWKLGAIEAHLNLVSKSQDQHLDFIRRLTDPYFVDELPDYASVKAMLDWAK